MRRSVVGILAHVDAGKTTLSEAMLYCSGALRTLGRVDHGDAFLDNFSLERQRGITIFSKQAVLQLPELQITLLDTPGHVDFAPEMERTLDVLDCAVLVVSGTAGVQSHTRTVWKLLRRRNIPALLFVNKTDLPGPGQAALLEELRRELGEGIASFSPFDPEAAALCDEVLLEEFLEKGTLSCEAVAAAVAGGRLFPCFFGAALKLKGVEEFLQGLGRLAPSSPVGADFGGKVFKISRDAQSVRLTHLKVTGGALRVRDTLSGDGWEEKVTQIRVYSGAKYRTVEEALPGDVVAVAGLTHTAPGQGLGAQRAGQAPALEPVLTYRAILPAGYDPHTALGQFRQLEEEEPQLHVDWEPRLGELRVRLMGPIQLEIFRQLLADRFGLTVQFDQGSILYRETIADTVEGIGHYEPLRHYAEVHLLLEPGPRGSGLKIQNACADSGLEPSWQRLILSHLAEKQHLGVLTGSPVTDMVITLLSGRAHQKHTEGGDFRQATYRAVRQGLMQAQSILLEPWYDFFLELPQGAVGRAMTDLQRMGARFGPPDGQGETAHLSGCVPVAPMREYAQEVASYTKGLGKLSLSLRGYEPCSEQDAVVKAAGYRPEADLENSPDSIFCSHGAGYNVKWSDVPRYMHLPSALAPPQEPEAPQAAREMAARFYERIVSDEELMAIYERTYGPIRRDRARSMRPRLKPEEPGSRRASPAPQGPEYLLVDGYNIIFAWEDLKALARESLDLARNRLIGILRNYQGFRQCCLILVFDAYRVKGSPGSIERMGDFSIVYTKEAETADMYIEKVTHRLAKNHRVRVATSDGLEQVIILGHGALRLSASAFREEVLAAQRAIREFLGEAP